MDDDDPIYLEKMLSWMYSMEIYQEEFLELRYIEHRVILQDLARKYNVIELVAQLNSEIQNLVKQSCTWADDEFATIDNVFKVVGDSDSWRALEDALVAWTCQEKASFGHIKWALFQDFLCRHKRLGAKIAVELMQNAVESSLKGW